MSGINSAMLAGVTGLSANSAALASISDDIANVNTVGYKANNTQFSDMVTNTAGSGFSSGGVQAVSMQEITVQGVMQSASSPTDLAISGNGFFVTSQTPGSPSTANSPMFTRAGAFSENSQGYLVNTAGLYLQGWLADSSGNITTDPSNLSLLSPINMSQITSDPVPTTAATLNANLNSSQTVSTGSLSTDNYSAIADSAAVNHNIAVTYTPDTAAANTYNVSAVDSVTGTTYTGTVTFNGTTGAFASGTGAFSTGALTLASTATIPVTSIGLSTDSAALATYNPVSNSMAAYTASGGTSGVKPDFTMQIPVSDSEGGTQTLQVNFMKTANANQWYAEVVSVPASSVKAGTGTPAGQIASGIVSFTNTGQLDTANTTLPLNLSFGASNATAPTSPAVNWGPSLGIGSQKVALDFSALTQDSAPSTVTTINANGTPTGTLSTVQVSSQGMVTAVFSNGTQRTIAQLAIATFANPDGLTAVSGDAYQTSLASGTYNLKTAGTAGAGTISSNNLESSTVDLSAEFTNMITTQRAYSASSKIITTADSMLQDLISIIR